MPAQQAQTPRRADAARNRELILTAARAGFAEPGAEVSMAEVARRAGVGMATLYRNFPGRRELLEALYVDEVDAICEAATTLRGDTAGDVLIAWVRRFISFFENKHPIAAELLSGGAPDTRTFVNDSRDRVMAAGSPLLSAAQEAGDIRPELTLEQILDLVIAIARIPGDRSYLEPILTAALAGLRP